jgi:hypothetical protein
LYDATGAAIVLNEGDTFDFGGDNNFLHNDSLCFYADDTAVDIDGDWSGISRATGKISVRVTIDSASLRTKISSSETLTGSKCELRRFESGTGDKSSYLMDSIMIKNVLILTEGAPEDEDPQYYTKAEIDAALSTLSYTTTFTNSDLVAGILTVTHNLGTLTPLYAVYNDSSKNINPSITITGLNTLTIDLSDSWGTISGTWRAIFKK